MGYGLIAKQSGQYQKSENVTYFGAFTALGEMELLIHLISKGFGKK